MENIQNTHFLGKLKKKFLSGIILMSLSSSLISVVLEVNATVTDGGGNILTGQNANIVNIANGSGYAVGFTLSGTLDPGNTLVITARDSIGKTTSNSYVSLSGSESTGSIIMDFSAPGWTDGTLSYSGLIYSGSIETLLVASGITLSGLLDRTRPTVTLIGTPTVTIVQGSLYSDSGASWEDTLDGTGIINTANSGSVNTSSTGSYVLEYWKTDMAGNTSSAISRTVTVTASPDTTNPLVAITSHTNNALVTGIPTLSGTMSDAGGIMSVNVNGTPASLGSGTWSKMLTGLPAGPSIITVVATDFAGNTGSTSLTLNRVAETSNINSVLSGINSASITFSTDLTVVGIVRYGTSPGSLNMTATGTNPLTSHSFSLTGLLSDTLYSFTVEGSGGVASSLHSFKTPVVVSTTTSGSTVISGSLSLTGGTLTGATFTESGSLKLLSVTSSGSFLSFPLSGLTIFAPSGNWDGIIQAPEVTGNTVSLTLSGYAFIGSPYQIGNANSELIFSGQSATVNIKISSTYSGQVARVFRSSDHGTTYTELTSCIISIGGDCTFTTNALSLFALALPADTVPDIFSFVGVTGAELGTTYTSNTIGVSGITGPTSISIVGGSYSKNGQPFTSLAGTTLSGDTITVQGVSSVNYSTLSNITLTIGSIGSTYAISTKAAPINNGGGGGGGGGSGPGGPTGGTGIGIDVCPGGDSSNSYYDGMCVVSPIPGNIINGIYTGSFIIPGIIRNISDIRLQDIQGNWAESFIQQLVIRGIIDNVRFYNPDAGLTRAEFLKIVLGTTGWARSTTGLDLPFHDVSINSWQAQYVALALQKGMIRRSISFRPNDTITRAEAAKILIITLGVTVTEPSAMTFIDVDRTSDLAKYIDAAAFLNIFSGQLMNRKRIFRPSHSITRSEIAKVVVNAFDLK